MDAADIEQLRTLSVLYVEDEDDVREQLAMFLRRRVGTLLTAANGKEGLEAYLAHKPDVVVTDVSMPVMGGLEMAEAIKADNGDIPVLITTAYNEPDFFLRSIEIGIDKYVIKPIQPEALLESILKAAQTLFKHRLVEAHKRLVRFVLDASSDFMVLMSRDGEELANRAFLRYLGYESLGDMRRAGCICLLGEREEPCSDDQTCFMAAREMPGVRHGIRVFSPKDQRPITFEVVYQNFDELGKYLFAFRPVDL